jgi:UDP-glucose 4-epimerase
MKGDVTQESDLEEIFEQYKFWAVIHFAAIKVMIDVINCIKISYLRIKIGSR